MIPDPATIARRRHTITIIVRFLIAAYGSWCFYKLAMGPIQSFLASLTSGMNTGGVLWSNVLNNCQSLIYSTVPQFAFLAGLILTEKRIVHWIVPDRAENICPKCGYSLKDLKSPICPECGMNIKTDAPAQNPNP